MANLYIVATPIGNLEDITLRAIRILGEVSTIFCEDTRVTKKLLSAHNINTQLMSYHAHSSESRHEKVLDYLAEGKDVALVTDAGTPMISDPGILLVQKVRERFGDKVQMIAIPGPSALTSAISVCDISCAQFTFLGFLPKKKGRRSLFKEMELCERTTIFYESPHRILRTLDQMADVGLGARKICIAREITKMHEETFYGNIDEAVIFFKNHPRKAKGEFVVIVAAEVVL